MSSIAKYFRLLADPTRLRLLLLLQGEELSVAELQEILGMGQSRISMHLSQLKLATLVRDRRAGKNIYYTAEDAAPDSTEARLAEFVQAGGREVPESARDRSALKLVLKKRQDTARDYFNKLAGRFGRSHCPGRSWESFAQMLLTLVGPITVADLGAGEGMFAQLLARHAKKVIAIDNSEKMVEFGADLAREHGFKNLEFRLGDIQEPPIQAGSIDLAILSQALHHAASPARAVAAAHRILKRGGRIAILDLLQHQFEQARDLYADLWLGFSENELHEMLKTAGFSQVQVAIVSREEKNPHLQTVLATGIKS